MLPGSRRCPKNRNRKNSCKTQSLVYDSYHRSRSTGSLILIDEATNNTVGAGMVV